jgi:molybdopterin molybdotransferase
MISFSKAKDILANQKLEVSQQILPLTQCINRIAAEEVYAPFDVPAFDKSMMDGYAVMCEDIRGGKEIKVIGEVQAGANLLSELKSGEAIRIFTGAPIPLNADTVLPQEDVSIENGIVTIHKPFEQGANIAKKGTQTQRGTQILRIGAKLTPEYIGFLATFGIHELRVNAFPKTGIITTGKELIPVGKTNLNYQTYDSNSVFLTAALQELGLKPEFMIWVDDDKQQLKSLVEEKLKIVDILIFTGGVSVGDYDFVKPVLEEIGVEELFYKVKQKPGKPIYAGKTDHTIIFGLPGNPGSVVACYHIYVKPFLQAHIFGHQNQNLPKSTLINNYNKKPGLTHFVKAYVENNTVEILANQMSYQMDAFAKANAFAVLEEDKEVFTVGHGIEIIKFRN